MNKPEAERSPRLAIVFYTGSGNTGRVAMAIAEGANEVPGVEVKSIALAGSDIKDGRYRNTEVMHCIDQADVLVMGSPTYMGGPAAQFKAFADASSGRWASNFWHRKMATGFTIAANACGEQTATLQYFSILAQQHGMAWLGMAGLGALYSDEHNPLGCTIGLALQSAEAMGAVNRIAAQAFGQRVAEAAVWSKALHKAAV